MSSERQPPKFLVPLSAPAPGAAARGVIVFVHALGGGVSIYQPIVRMLAPEYRAYGLQCFHWITTRSLPCSVGRMAQHYLDEISELEIPARKLVLVGASSGGLVALEIARMLTLESVPPVAVFMGDTRQASSRVSTATSALADRMLWACFVEAFAPWSLPHPVPAAHPFWALTRQGRFEHIVGCAAAEPNSASGAPLTVASLTECFETYRKYFQLYATHRPQPYAGPVTYLMSSRATRREFMSVVEQLTGSVTLEGLEGGHLGMLEPPHAERVAKMIERAIDCENSGALDSASRSK